MVSTVQGRSALQVSARSRAQQQPPQTVAVANRPQLPQENRSSGPAPSFSRRLALGLLPASLQLASLSLTAPPPADAAESVFSRLEAAPSTLSQPFYMGPFDSKTIYYPRWMFGEWNVHSKFVGLNIPLGPKFVPDGFFTGS